MNRLRFGTYLAPNVVPVHELVTREVGRHLGIETELVVGRDCGRSVCFSDVIVQQDSPFPSSPGMGSLATTWSNWGKPTSYSAR